MVPDTVDYTEVPHLQELLSYLPINPEDEEDIVNYVQNITNLIAVNYKYGQYQFAYFGVHLLYMTYIYCTAWKIGQIEPDRYRDAIVYQNGGSPFERTMFGAYVLFPYSNEEDYRHHRFYESIGKVNIGGLPFLPSAMSLVSQMLDEL